MTSFHNRAWALQDRLAGVVRKLPWWVVTLLGLVSLGAGIALLAPAGEVDMRLRILVGLGFALSGIDDLVTGFGRTPRASGWVRVATGCIAVIGGLAVFFGAFSHEGLIWLAAFIYLSSGIARIAAVARRDSERPRLDLVFGVLDVGLALACAFLPGLGEVWLRAVLGGRSVLVGLRIVTLATTKLRRAQQAARAEAALAAASADSAVTHEPTKE